MKDTPKINIPLIIKTLSNKLNLHKNKLTVKSIRNKEVQARVRSFIFEGSTEIEKLVIELRVKDIHPRLQLEWLIHELVHVDQINRGDLRWNLKRQVVWKGKVMKRASTKDFAKYWEQPWEQECYLAQFRLADWIENKLGEKVWN